MSHLRRFRGLLRAEIEKVVLFANSRLGELSDTIGSLHYSSYEDDQEEMRKKYPSLVDGGMHQLSSSDSDGASTVSSFSGEQDDNMDLDGNVRRLKSDTSSETKKQIMLRDRLRISKPMFQKADFLGEDFSLLSAVDEADAYTAVGVELMHLLKYVCVNIISVRKICRKHDRLLSNRMLGGYYQQLAMETNKSQGFNSQHHFFHLNEARSQQFGGYIAGLYDIKIQQIANSTTMQTVSSSLALALADFEASQSRSALLGLGLGSKSKGKGSGTGVAQPELPSRRRQTTRSRLKQAVSYQISGQCFRGGDESTVGSQEDQEDENASTSSNTSLTRLRFVVTSIFGLREAARLKTVPFDYYSSRLFMYSIGPNVSGDGLNGCSRETLDFFCSYQPDAVSRVSCAPGKATTFHCGVFSSGGTIGMNRLDFFIAFFYSLLSTSTQRLLLAFSLRTISPVLVGIYVRLGGFLLIPSNLAG